MREAGAGAAADRLNRFRFRRAHTPPREPAKRKRSGRASGGVAAHRVTDQPKSSAGRATSRHLASLSRCGHSCARLLSSRPPTRAAPKHTRHHCHCRRRRSLPSLRLARLVGGDRAPHPLPFTPITSPARSTPRHGNVARRPQNCVRQACKGNPSAVEMERKLLHCARLCSIS